MKETKRSYYRNWYQHWQIEKEEEEKQLAMKYFSDMQEEEEVMDPLDLELYKANHDLSRQLATSENYKRNDLRDISHQGPVMRESQTGAGALRGLLIALPIIAVFITAMYAVGIIPQDIVNQIFNADSGAPIVAYMATHDEVMTLHNEINLSLESYVPTENVTAEFQEELRTKHALVQEQTELLMDQSDAAFSNMNRLWSLKMMSLNEMVDQVLSHDEVTPEVLAYYSQFVQDQNEIGEQISLALSTLFDANDIEYIELVNGDIELVN